MILLNYKDMTNIKLLAITPHEHDTTSFYRAHGVFNDLRKQLSNTLIIDRREAFTWVDIENSDIVFLQRPYTNEHLGMVKYAKEMNKPLWVDYDDNLFEISPANFMAYEHYYSDEIKNNMLTIIATADVVTVTTEELRRTLSKLNKNVEVIPNAMNTETFGYRDRDIKKREKGIVWRGGGSHFLDISDFSHEIYYAVNKFPGWQFSFMGMMPWFLDPKRENVRYFPVEDVIVYFRRLLMLSPSVMQVPLQNTHFNHCKSNIAYIEGIFSGGLVVGPDWEEWRLPGALVYKNEKQYQDLLTQVCKGNVDVETSNRQGWEYINDNLTLNCVNKKRVELINRLMDDGN